MIYLILFGISILLFCFSDNSTGLLKNLAAFLGILSVCWFASVRDPTIGTDIKTYGFSFYYSATMNSLPDHIILLKNNYSPLFCLITWIAVKITGSFAGMLFAIQLCSIVPVYITIRKFSNKCTALGMGVYFLSIFPITLNLLKQGIAISFVFVAGYYAIQKSPIKFILASLAAIGFHITAIISLFIYPLFYLIRGEGRVRFFGKWSSLIFVVIITTLSISIFLFGPNIVRLIAPLRDAYSYQVNQIGKGTLSINNLAFAILSTVLLYRFIRLKNGDLDYRFECLYVITLLGFVASQFDLISESLSRLSYYFTIFNSLLLIIVNERNEKSASITVFIILAALLFIFYYSIILMGYQQVYPYTSAIIGIY